MTCTHLACVANTSSSRHPCIEAFTATECRRPPCDFISRGTQCAAQLLRDLRRGRISTFLPATGAAARAHYDRLLNQSGFGKVLLPQLRKARAPVLATWDDHGELLTLPLCSSVFAAVVSVHLATRVR